MFPACILHIVKMKMKLMIQVSMFWLHITNFLATKESVQVSLPKQKTYTAENSSLSLLELRLHTHSRSHNSPHTVGELQLNGPNLPCTFLFPIAHVVELCNELLAKSKVIKHWVMYSTLTWMSPGVYSAMLHSQWRSGTVLPCGQKQNTKEGGVFPWGKTNVTLNKIN